MKRKWIGIVAFGVAAAIAQGAVAQPTAAKPLKIVVPWTPGGGVDTLARLLQPSLAEGLGRSVIVENKPGATGAIGVDSVAKSPPDGSTLIIGSPANMVVLALLNPKLPYNPLKDFEPVAMGTLISNVLVVHPSLAVNSVADLIAMAKAQPGKLTFGSSGVGSSLHLSAELLKLMAKIDIVHVPYKGTAPAVADVAGGQITMLFSDPSALPLVKAGKLRALAQTMSKRSAAMPDLPTVAESGLPGFELVNWYAFFAPAGTPAPMVARLNAELVRALKLPDVTAKLITGGQDPAPGTPQQLGTFHRDDVAKWSRVVEAGRITME
jgi:tripartite-type tricarboxylate transporter receptor subunit TctC